MSVFRYFSIIKRITKKIDLPERHFILFFFSLPPPRDLVATSLTSQNFIKIKRQHVVRRLRCRSQVKKKKNLLKLYVTPHRWRVVIFFLLFFIRLVYILMGLRKTVFFFFFCSNGPTRFALFLPVSSFTTDPRVATRYVVFRSLGFFFFILTVLLGTRIRTFRGIYS